MTKKIIQTESAPTPIGPYSQAVFANNMLFISGQIGIDPETGHLISTDINAETTQVMQNLRSILHANQMDFKHVVKTCIFLSDMDLFQRVNDIYSAYFTEQFPARETVAVKGLPKAANVEISMIATL